MDAAPNATIRDFASSEEARVEFRGLALVVWPTMRDARPNAGHEAFAELHRQGRLDTVITQNIDGLHQCSELPAEMVIELHDTATEAVCLDCGHRVDAHEVHRRVEAGELTPRCRPCAGMLKPATTLFGEALPPGVMARAAVAVAVAQCNILLAVGSSLEVEPAASLPGMAREAGARVIVVNREPTRRDNIADVVVHGELGAVLPALVRHPGGERE